MYSNNNEINSTYYLRTINFIAIQYLQLSSPSETNTTTYSSELSDLSYKTILSRTDGIMMSFSISTFIGD